MKKTLLSFAIMSSFALGANASASGKIDLPLKMLVGAQASGKAMVAKSMSLADEGRLVDILIKSSDPDLTAADIEAAGGTARGMIGDILTALVPTGFVEELAAHEEVLAIEASKKLHPLMDSARSNTGVDSVQSGTADGTAYNGKNVVVGAIDTGLDYSRSDFMNSEGRTRVQYLRFQTASGSSFSLTECTKGQITGGSCTIPYTNDSEIGHGSHVLGIAAGSNSTYTGVAPEADIMLVRNDFSDFIDEGGSTFSSSLIDGVDAIFEKADVLDKPAVVNISQGSNIGAHDDTSLMEQAMNSAVTGGYASGGKSYGRAIVAAAGNEVVVSALLGGLAVGAGGIHAGFNVPAGASHGYRLWVLMQPSADPLYVDAWFGAGQGGRCSITAKAYNAANYNSGTLTTTSALIKFASDLPLNADNSGVQASSSDNKVTIVEATDASDTNNSKPRALFAFGPGSAGSWNNIVADDTNGDGTIDAGYIMDVIIRAGAGGACSGNMWIDGGGTDANFMKSIDTGAFDVGAGANGAGYAMKAGDNNDSVALPGTASGVIAVGSYLQQKPWGSGASRWRDMAGTTFDATNPASDPSGGNAGISGGTVSSRSPFSSIGPTADGRRKPEVLAPGDPIISVLPSGHSVDAEVQIDATHYKNQGTSQASPHVAGIVALLFTKNNTLTAAQVKSTLTSTASKSASPNDSDGWGNVNAAAAIVSLSANTSGYSGTGDLGDSSGGGSSGGGCQLGALPAAGGSATSLIAMLLVAIPGLTMAIKRKF